MIRAVLFDLDGVLVDSEAVWERVRRDLVTAYGLPYRASITHDVMGMSAPEWSAYLRDVVGVPLAATEIDARVVAGVAGAYRAALPLVDGAAGAVRALAARVPLAIASSSNRSLIELVVERAGLADAFAAIVSAEEVGIGKPAPAVYLRAAERLGVAAVDCGAVEDSGNGIRAAHAAGTFVVAVPNVAYPPAASALALADRILGSVADVVPGTFGLA